MYSWIYLLIISGNVDFFTYGILFEYRLRCPDTPEKWRENTNSYICHGDTVYHCMLDQEGRYVVFCASSIWIQPDYCPELNRRASLIDVILCRGSTDGCPESVYLSNSVYQYPSCLQTVNRPTSTSSPPPFERNATEAIISRHTTQLNEKNGKDGMIVKYVIGIIVAIIIPILSLLLIVCLVYLKKHTGNKKTFTSCPEQGTLLGHSMVPDKENGRKSNAMVPDTENESKSNKMVPATDYKSKEIFCKLKLYDVAVTKIQNNGFVLIYGKTGSGKTTFTSHLLTDKLPGYFRIDLKAGQKKLPELKHDKCVVVWDDCFGIWNVGDDEKKCDILENIKGLFQWSSSNSENKKAVVCFDSFFFETIRGLYDDNSINLDNYFDTQMDKEHMQNLYGMKFLSIPTVLENTGLPLLISLIHDGFCPIEKRDIFLKNPEQFLSDNFYKLLRNDIDVYVSLVYAVCKSPCVNLTKRNEKHWKALLNECKKTQYTIEAGVEETNDNGRTVDFKGNLREDVKHKANVQTGDRPHIETSKTYLNDVSEEFMEDSPHGEKSDSIEGLAIRRDGVNENNCSCGNDKVSIEDNQEENSQSDNNTAKGKVGYLKKISLQNKVVEMNDTLAKYLVKMDNSEEFRFRHQFLAEQLLRYHLKKFGKEGVLEVGNSEVKWAVVKMCQGL